MLLLAAIIQEPCGYGPLPVLPLPAGAVDATAADAKLFLGENLQPGDATGNKHFRETAVLLKTKLPSAIIV